MWLNSYQETCIHDEQKKWWWESSVFRVDYPDGTEECRKEYTSSLSRTLLGAYCDVHNLLSKQTVEFDVDISLENRPIHKIRFLVLPIHTIAEASSLEDKEELSIATMPYVWGIYRAEMLELFSPKTMYHLIGLRDDFISILVDRYPFFSGILYVDSHLSDINMKCIVREEDQTMDVIITDLSGYIKMFGTMCDIDQLNAYKTLQS